MAGIFIDILRSRWTSRWKSKWILRWTSKWTPRWTSKWTSRWTMRWMLRQAMAGMWQGIEGNHKSCKTERRETQMGSISAGVEGQDFTFLHILLLLKYEPAWSTLSAYFIFCIYEGMNFNTNCKKARQLINGILHQLLNYDQYDTRWVVNQSFVLFKNRDRSTGLWSIIGQMHR